MSDTSCTDPIALAPPAALPSQSNSRPDCGRQLCELIKAVVALQPALLPALFVQYAAAAAKQAAGDGSGAAGTMAIPGAAVPPGPAVPGMAVLPGAAVPGAAAGAAELGTGTLPGAGEGAGTAGAAGAVGGSVGAGVDAAVAVSQLPELLAELLRGVAVRPDDLRYLTDMVRVVTALTLGASNVLQRLRRGAAVNPCQLSHP